MPIEDTKQEETTPEQQLTKKLKSLGYPDFDIAPDPQLENVLMLYMQGRLICSVNYALSIEDAQLKTLVDETVAVPGD